jgi:hypothetical protein
MPVFYPSAVLNFKLKFDEELTLVQGGPLIEHKPTEVTASMLLNPKKKNPVITQKGASNVSWVMARVPKTLDFEKPGYRQAGKFSLEMDFNEMPIDPRTVRAAAVEIHLGTVSSGDFGAGMRQVEFQGRPTSILKTRDDDGLPNATTLRMVGIVDEWEIEHNPDGSLVTMMGRDLRGVLLDTPIAPIGTDEQMLSSIEWSKPIDEVVTQIIAYNPFFEDMRTIVNPADWEGGTLPSPGFPDIIPRAKKGAKGKKDDPRSNPPSSSSKLNFWDLIVRSCYLVGGIPYMLGPHVAIRPSATVYDRLRGPLDPDRNPTPFAGGRARDFDQISGSAINPPLRARKIIYGRDTEVVRVSRKFAGWRKPKVIRTISVNLDAADQGGQLVEAYWPRLEDLAARRTSETPGKDKVKEDVVNVPVPGVTDPDRLTLIARSIYEEIGRGELGGEVETNNLSSFGGNNADPDLLRLEPGDGIEFGVDVQAIRSGTAPLVSSYTDFNRKAFESQVKEVGDLLGDINLARVIVGTARNQVSELQSFFRTQNVKFNWDYQSGVKISFDFQNYVVARAQVEEASGDPGTATQVAVGASQGSSTDTPGPGSLGAV